MKPDAKISLLILCGVVTTLMTHAITSDPNPYHPISSSNIFRLQPPPTFVPPPVPVPRIFLQGTTSVLGFRQALFKVQPAKPGDKERSYILSEGQREDGIEVLAIDENEERVKFDNHGTIQILAMKESVRGSTTDLSRTIVVTAPVPVSAQSTMTAEEQMVMIEIERERTKAQVEAGELPPLPPTELTPRNPD